MPLLQPKLNLKVSQRQILTPGLMQMVSVLALNKLELKEMINAEITENPILEELDENLPLIDDTARNEEDRPIDLKAADGEADKKDPFDEIDFGSYFQEYLDPGFRSPNSFELTETPSIENYLSKPGTLSDHLFWQLGSLSLTPAMREAAEYIIGNLDEDGYLPATDEELLDGYLREQLAPEAEAENGNEDGEPRASLPEAVVERARKHLEEGLKLVRQLDPVGIATRGLRECLMVQIEVQQREFNLIYARKAAQNSRNGHNGNGQQNGMSHAGIMAEMAASANEKLSCGQPWIFDSSIKIVDKHLSLLQKRDLREVSRAAGLTVDQAQQVIDFIRTLDPRPGQRYNRSDARLIEPDVAFVKRGDEYVVSMNEEDMPTLRLNQGYRKLLTQQDAGKDVKDYVKERYRSALQLMRNIEQRKNTILRTCEAIVRRQQDFLEYGVEAMKPMMIKEVAEEIGVHPSTVSRAVSNKYVHTPQGVYELRFFFSEGVNGPEGAGTPLMLLKRRVKKLIEEEDPSKPLTDDQIALMLQTSGINVTRRTVAKYREDMRIPSTHQRRVRG